MHTLEHLPRKGSVKRLAPLGRSLSYAISHKDGREITVTKDQVDRIGRFGKLLKQHAEALGLSWEVVEQEEVLVGSWGKKRRSILRRG